MCDAAALTTLFYQLCTVYCRRYAQYLRIGDACTQTYSDCVKYVQVVKTLIHFTTD